VPGRHSEKGDSALSRLRNLLADGMNLRPVHRLDQDTSGILLFARDLESYRSLSRQFERV
jgi:tRNA pseudouridine32 synthase / 23S rRNA pseudouridine746 synthase